MSQFLFTGFQGSVDYDCVNSMTDDEELDCLSRPPPIFPRDKIRDPPSSAKFFNYENLILLIGALLGFIGSILLAFMIARRNGQESKIICTTNNNWYKTVKPIFILFE